MAATPSRARRALGAPPPLPRAARAAAVLAGVALTLGVGACEKKEAPRPLDGVDELSLLAEDGTDSATAETDAEVVTSSLVSAAAAGGSLSLASSDLAGGNLSTAGVGDGAKAIYFPRGCLAVTSDTATRTVSYAFTGCTGPNGIFKITGTIVATYEVSPDKLVLNLVGNSLLVNRSTVDWSARAEITADGPTRTMVWHGQLAGATARGREFTRTNDKVVRWRFGGRCFDVSGVSEGNVRGRYLRTEVAGFRRCQGACPEAGGRITITNAESKLKVEILFDGTNRAAYTTPRGSTVVDLVCKG